jgi:hypothetical protein
MPEDGLCPLAPDQVTILALESRADPLLALMASPGMWMERSEMPEDGSCPLGLGQGLTLGQDSGREHLKALTDLSRTSTGDCATPEDALSQRAKDPVVTLATAYLRRDCEELMHLFVVLMGVCGMLEVDLYQKEMHQAML